MFKYCVWYLIHERHPIHTQIKKYATQFKTIPFKPHISLRTSLEKEEAKEWLDTYKKSSKPFFFSQKEYNPKSTSTLIDDVMFHAIEVPLMVDNYVVEGMHVSLAYRLGGDPFTQADLDSTDRVDTIRAGDIEMVMVDCRSKNPSAWEVLKS